MDLILIIILTRIVISYLYADNTLAKNKLLV